MEKSTLMSLLVLVSEALGESEEELGATTGTTGTTLDKFRLPCSDTFMFVHSGFQRAVLGHTHRLLQRAVLGHVHTLCERAVLGHVQTMFT